MFDEIAFEEAVEEAVSEIPSLKTAKDVAEWAERNRVVGGKKLMLALRRHFGTRPVKAAGSDATPAKAAKKPRRKAVTA